MRWRAPLAVALLVAVAAAALALRSRGGAEDSAGASADAASVEPHRVAHSYVAGSEVTYTLAYESDGTMQLGAQTGARLVSTLRARLVRTVVTDASQGHAQVLYRFLDADVLLAVDGANAAAVANGVALALAEGVLAEETSSGRIVSMRAAAGAPPMALSFARTLLAGLQVTLPERVAPSWSARETDTNGDYVARYAVVGEAEPPNGELGIKKTKLSSTSGGAEQGGWTALARGDSRTSGATEIDFDVTHGAVKEIASEQTVQSLVGALEVATTRTKLDVERTGARLLDGPALAQLLAGIAALREAEPAPLDVRTPVEGDTARASASKQWLGTSTLPELVLALRASEGKAQDDRHFDLFLKVHALTYLHPEECARVARLLPPLDPTGSSFQVVVAALGATGSKEAQAALIGALESRETSREAKKHLLATLGMVTFPDERAEAALRSLRDEPAASPELAATAALGLGIMAKSLAVRSPGRAKALIDDALTRALAHEHDEPRLLADLQVLGNTGSPRIQHDVLRWSHATSAAVRGEAAFALRLVRTEDAEARLLEVLAHDADPALRSRMATALSYRDGSERSLKVQRERALADDDAGVRAALLRNLYAMRDLFPEALATLEERRHGDPDARVRALVDGLLGSAATP